MNGTNRGAGRGRQFILMALIFTGGMLILVAVALIAFSFQYPAEPVDAASVALEDLQGGMGLSIADAVLLDQYASSGLGDHTEAYHCVVTFAVADGKRAVASLRVPTEGALSEIMWAYMNDEAAGPGDCVVTLCATTTPLGAKLAEYLQAYVGDAADELALGDAGDYGVATVSLAMRGETPWEYTESVLNERKNCRAGGAFCLLAGSALLFAAFGKRGH
ncbi:MAG: hypothetical protein IKO07_03260 [Clostridia bacterium]|nr:hypothetical protein [Clostridia bacterium]